jgi:hypothetical protein
MTHEVLLKIDYGESPPPPQKGDYVNETPLFKGEGKAIPLQAWTGPEGSRSLRLPDFTTIGT